MFCEHCGVQNPETAIYCRACGKRMEGKRENQPHHHVFQGTILFLAGPLTGRSFPLIPPVTTLGRDPSNTIVVPDPAMSPFHARLVLTGSGWVVELLAPENTLMVSQNQTRQQLLRDQDVIRLGYGTVFRYGLNMGMPQSPQPPIPPVQPPPPGQAWQSQPFPPVPRPQQIRYGPLLSRRTVLIGGAVLAGGLLLVVGGKLLSSPFSPLSQPFQHVALGTHPVRYKGHDAPVLTVAWSSDSIHIASGANSYDPTVKVWNALDGIEVYTYQYYALSNSPAAPVSVRSLAWSPEGMRIVTSDDSGFAVHAWDATDGGQETTFELPSTLSIDEVWQVAWSPDGKRIAAACGNIDLTTNNLSAGTVLVWDVASAKVLAHYAVQSTIYSVAWSSDSLRIAATIENTVQVLSVGNWQTLFTYQGHTDFVNSVAWSPDGKRIASGSGSFQGKDNTVQVWDATNGNTLSTYRGHTNAVETVAWSPDSQRLASGSDDWTVQVWDAADARQIYVYRGHSDRVNQVAWSPDGTRIASASNDNTVQVWGAG